MSEVIKCVIKKKEKSCRVFVQISSPTSAGYGLILGV